MAARPAYHIRPARVTPELRGLWDGPAWGDVPVVDVGSFHAKSSDHRPTTQAKVLIDDRALYVHFRVADRFVRCVKTEVQTYVCQDSCVEFFVEPVSGKGYFNMEMNCGGTLLTYYIEDPTYRDRKMTQSTALTPAELAEFSIYHSLPRVVDPEIAEPTLWQVEYRVPLALFEKYAGPIARTGTWRGNFFKCADHTSHPHWASWSPIGEKLNFHQPEYFRTLAVGPA